MRAPPGTSDFSCSFVASFPDDDVALCPVFFLSPPSITPIKKKRTKKSGMSARRHQRESEYYVWKNARARHRYFEKSPPPQLSMLRTLLRIRSSSSSCV